ncbi:MAG: hypothetical protein OXJ52_02030 [Oligoflexia bacterium]|nr:hypothetical protein [Oligoflexia bacterium]
MKTKTNTPEFYTKRFFLRELQLSNVESYEKRFADYKAIQYLRHICPTQGMDT